MKDIDLNGLLPDKAEVIVVLVPAPVIPCVGVTFTGHRIVDWDLTEFDEYILALADVENVGLCPYSYSLKAILIYGQWHATDSLPFRMIDA